ncbi:Dynamin [Penicillium odoratum]|uniref:Dynamin n=1 Tax=Penicillium odoratum TaxID=1167516 RepID=UPI002548B5E2|nr:Dynamin [Penicillium odoratum]KAJ5768945.1 Dynamin [Penicillium odoratum]
MISMNTTQLGESVGLHSSKTSGRLNGIDKFRANGVSEHISLPQIVVCGDQSAGKSSVLEGISGIPFPRQDGLCTHFATELILRHDPSQSQFTATITPHPSRDEDTKAKLKDYRHEFQDFAELPSITKEAAKLIGLSTSDTEVDKPCFAEDILRLELVGNTGVHLTIVDLPGLRTQSRVARLANNRDQTKLKLGFFILKNPTPNELKAGMTGEIRRKMESTYFSTPPWSSLGLDPDRVGIDKLRIFLQDLLDSHIEQQLPTVRADVRRLLERTNQELNAIGNERKSPSQIRTFLTRISADCHRLVQAAVEGSYGGPDSIFFLHDDDKPFIRLRAAVHIGNETFSSYMSENGAKRKTVLVTENPESPERKRWRKRSWKVDSSSESLSKSEVEDGQLAVTQEELMNWVRQAYKETRGQELPGSYNHCLVTRLFHEQSSRWAEISRDHVSATSRLVSLSMETALEHTIKDIPVRHKIHHLVRKTLESNTKVGNHELAKLIDDETRQPMTYNHYYTDNVQKSRDDRSRSQVAELLSHAIDSAGHMSADSMLTYLKKNSIEPDKIVDTKEQACSDALMALGSYYKVACKTFVDNVCRQVIERHILAKLNNAFNPMTVSCYSDEELVSLAAEPPPSPDLPATF